SSKLVQAAAIFVADAIASSAEGGVDSDRKIWVFAGVGLARALGDVSALT
ncbi:MAG: hypothetical protein GXP04_09135, partial [Alphaproteobacteria bacterium]|nr:hypothetical protein [Alphaproteobacteria bacterium]